MWGALLALVVAFEAAADVFAKSWSVRGGVVLAAAALTLYVIDNTFWLFLHFAVARGSRAEAFCFQLRLRCLRRLLAFSFFAKH